jgi:hypothetical protein
MKRKSTRRRRQTPKGREYSLLGNPILSSTVSENGKNIQNGPETPRLGAKRGKDQMDDLTSDSSTNNTPTRLEEDIIVNHDGGDSLGSLSLEEESQPQSQDYPAAIVHGSEVEQKTGEHLPPAQPFRAE